MRIVAKDEAEEEEEEEEELCGTFGCTLPDGHAGLHRIPELEALTPTLTLTRARTLTRALRSVDCARRGGVGRGGKRSYGL